MSDAVQAAIAKARAGGKKASAKDAAPAAAPEPAPLVTASSAVPAHEIEVLPPVQPDESTLTLAESAEGFAAEAARNAEWDEGTLGREEDHVEVAGSEQVEPIGEVLTDTVRLEAPLANDGYGDAEPVNVEGPGGYHWGTPDEPATAPSGDVHPAFAKLPPAGLSVPVFKG